MRPATPAVMGRNLAVPRGNRRRSQGNDSNDERPAGCRSPAGERGRNTDFSDALGDRRIEEVNEQAK